MVEIVSLANGRICNSSKDPPRGITMQINNSEVVVPCDGTITRIGPPVMPNLQFEIEMRLANGASRNPQDWKRSTQT